MPLTNTNDVRCLPDSNWKSRVSVPDPLVIVPARGGSRRLPKKNVGRLGGLSLLGWTLACAHGAGFEKVLLSTDDEEIAAEGAAVGYWVPFRRPAELAGSAAPTVLVLLHALDWCRDSYSRDPELVVLLQATSPFRAPSLITEALGRMARQPDIDAIVAVKKLHVPLGAVYVDAGGFLASATERGKDNGAYVPSGALYLVKSKTLRTEQTVIPAKCAWISHEGVSTLDIDTPEDWAIAEALIASRQISVPAILRNTVT